MKARAILLVAVLSLVSPLGCRPAGPSLEVVSPEEAGLTWQECAVPDPTWPHAEACFGHPMPLWGEAETAIVGERLDNEAIRLAIGEDLYLARPSSTFLWQRYTLYRNGRPVKRLSGEFSTYSPNLLLLNVADRAAWEFSDGNIATVIYDGLDLRDLYGLDKAYRPYALGDKLILVGQQAGRHFVIYDGKRVGPDFDQISIAYCCEPVMWSVQYGRGRYLFWGMRGGQWVVVEVALAEA